ncbi:MAG: triple tyrosine motif-containing protein [Chitinophagaceae bacterium]
MKFFLNTDDTDKKDLHGFYLNKKNKIPVWIYLIRVIRVLFFLIVSCTAINSFAQNAVLIPEIINFSKKTYEAGNQNRAIGQDKRGILYFANDDGLLVFDGTYWRTYSLPNKSIVRSALVTDDRIYVGGQQEIGYFFFDKKGKLSYQSLKPLIPDGEEEFSDVWRILKFNNDIFYQSNKRLFRLHKDKLTAYKSANWAFLGASKQILVAQQFENGLMLFKNDKWVPFNSGEYDFSKDKVAVRSTTDFGSNKTLITTLKSGAYIIDGNEIHKFDTPSITSITTNLIYTSCAIDTSTLVVATKLDGYYIINTNGDILQHVTRRDGLQSNAVNAVFIDKDKNLWLGLDNGIDLIVRNNPINHIIPSRENKSPGYSAMVYNNQLYIGTGIGLYSIPLPANNNITGMQGDFKLVKNSDGVVWALSVVNNQLLVGHGDGAFIVQGDRAVPLDTNTGYWTFQPFGGQQPSPIMLAGTYNGMNLFHYADGKFINPRIHTFFESAKFAVIVNDDIWVVHPYQGLYRISINDSGKLVNQPYKDVHNILSSGHNHLFKIRNKIVLVTRKGIFEYDRLLNDFKESVYLNKLFHGSFVSYLKEDSHGNIWFIQDKRPGVVDLSEPDNPAIIYFSELNNSVLGNDEEFIYPINENNILIGGEIGFYHIDYEKYKETNHGLKVLLRSVTAFHRKDSTLFSGYLPESDSASMGDIYNSGQHIGYQWNSLHFEFSSPYFGGIIEYSCRLKGYEDEWSDWSKRTERSYTNLPAGDYEFEVKARNNIGGQSPVSRFIFTVSPPWYRTWIAYFLYVVLITATIYFFYKRQKKKYLVQHNNKLKKQQEEFEEEQKRLLYQHQLEIEKNEKEIIGLKNIKLEAEVQHNNAELASNTMSLLQKREVLNKIKDEILKIQQEPDAEKKTKNLKRLLKTINEQLDVHDGWEQFSVYFDRVNNDFLKILKDKFPGLTPTDLRLCAYLQLNLSTKEIADLLNLSIRGVESSRYRLRKKLDLTNDMSLYAFLDSVGKSNQDKP